jgi:hypothetical protein
VTIKQLTEHERRAHKAARGASSALVRSLGAAAIISLFFGFQGCGEHDELPEMTKQAVKYEEVPEIVRAAASKAIPDVKLNEAWKNLERGGKLHSYEIRGKNAANGKTREVRVSLTGEVLETE